MTPCAPIRQLAGPCFYCRRYTDGLHYPSGGQLACSACCPAWHKGQPKRCNFTPDELLALRLALDFGPSLEGKLLGSLPVLTPTQGAQALALANAIPNLPATLRAMLPRPVVKPV